MAKKSKPAADKRTADKPTADKPDGKGADLYALLIACDFYLPNLLPEGTYPNLGGCVRDVEHVEAFLRRRLGLTDDHLVKLTSSDGGGTRPRETPDHWPTYENMVNGFRKITKMASRGDQVYVHYSGHGGQTPTSVPKVKGARGLDETLVPVDIGNDTARYLRDVEVATLLKEMTEKGLVLTVVFDCCHSGGAARSAVRADTNLAVRGVTFIDHKPRPTDSLVGTPEELADALPAPAVGQRAAVTRSLVAQAAALGYTLLAACRPSESAYESAFEGSERNGALTYWLLNALQDLSPQLTYRMVYDRLLGRIHSQFEKQTPLLQGDPDRVVFGTVRLKPEFATVVLAVAADNKTVQLNAGQANLIRPGARFAVYPNGTLDFTATDKRTALVCVREVGAAAATADVVEVFGHAQLRPGDAAVLLGAPAQRLVRKVRVERADGKPPALTDQALQAVLKAMPDSGWVESISTPGDAADFVVRLDGGGSHYLICDGDGQELSLHPEVGVADAGAAATVVKRLTHLARFRAVQDLDNNDSNSPLKGKLVVKLLGVQDQFDPADKPAPKPFPADGPPSLRVGQWTFLSIENRSNRDLNIAVLDLQPDWGVTYAYPQDTGADFMPLSPGGEPLVIPLPAGLSEGYVSGTDTLKVLATIDPTSFRPLELPVLDQRVATKAARGGSVSPLDGLLGALAAERPRTRNFAPTSAPSQGWAVAQVEVRVTAAGDVPAGRGESAPVAVPPVVPTTAGKLASAPVGPPLPEFMNFRERSLSLWQSAVEEATARRAGSTGARGPGTGADITSQAVQGSDPVRSANALAAALHAGEPLNDPLPPGAAGVAVGSDAARGITGSAWKCSKLAMRLAWAKASGDALGARKLADELSFGTCDPLWAETVENYLAYFKVNQGNIPYRSGGDYVLDFALPRDATVAIIGDWGTGTPTAAALLAQVARKQPNVVLHLGDIYYSGTRAEVQARFLNVCRAVLGATPVYSLCGNHDVYSGGTGYYWLVDQLGQRASYFCLRNDDWQFLAMDTGYNDFNPLTIGGNITSLTDEELAWHRGKLRDAETSGRRTVLLSHHQPFSAYDAIGKDGVNRLLMSQLQDVLGGVEAWFWGHEHALGIYAPYLGVHRGRCVGCSAVPVFVEDDFYTPKFEAPLLPDPADASRPVVLGATDGIYNRAYAILKLNGRRAAVSYYQDSDENNPLYTETIE